MKLCQCGCGTPTVIATKTCTRDGYIKGEGRPFLVGHQFKGKPSHWRTHNMTRINGKHTPEFAAYIMAKDRCSNLNSQAWKNYGGRGIEFRFKSFTEFYLELGPRPNGLTLDRINNDGHYEIGNVRWATRSQQQSNQRRQRG
jgi:hypothetical protein